MAERIALFANRDSAQLAEIAAEVAALGGRPVPLDIQTGPQVAMSVAADRQVWAGEDFADIRAVHVRCTAPRTLPTLPALLSAGSHAEQMARFLREQEHMAATYAFLEELVRQGRLVVNPLTRGYVDHNAKGQLYDRLADAGFRVPPTLSTTSPAAARRFVASYEEVVVKPSIGVGSTRLVDETDLERLEELKFGPALFQQRIVGAPVRVHVVGDRVVVALRILSDAIDSRTETRGFEPQALAAEEKAAIAAATRSLDLHYAAWDAILDAEGRLTYLDCNPGPFVMWIGPTFRRTVFRELARYLLGFARSGSVAEASAAVRDWQP